MTVDNRLVCPGIDEVDAAFPIASSSSSFRIQYVLMEEGKEVWKGKSDGWKKDKPLLTPTRRSEFKMDDLPTFGIPATSIDILSSGPSSSLLDIPVNDPAT